MNPEFTRVPHRALEATIVQTAALLIDFDNVTMGIRSNLGQELRKLLDSDIIRGKVAVQRAYADWRRYPQYIVPLSEASIDLIFAPAYGSSKKNATDIRLAIDACELVFTRPEIGTFILLSGDSDFSSLVLKLKEYGKYVIGVGLQESASDILVQNCDEYYSYSQVSGLRSAGEIELESHDPWVLVSKAILRMADRGDVMRSDRLKQVMLEIDPNFDEKGAGYSKFNRFLAEATHRDLIEMRKGQNGQYEVAPGTAARENDGGSAGTSAPRESGSAPASRPSRSGGRNRRGGRGRARGEGGRGREAASESPQAATEAPEPAEGGSGPDKDLRTAYEALAAVVADMYDGSEPVRDSMAKRRLIARDAGFDEAKLGFPKFSLFLKQADEDGAVRLEQNENGNYYLTPVAEPKGGRRTQPAPRSGRPSGGQAATTGTGGEKPAQKRGLLDRLFGARGKDETEEAPGSSAPSESGAAAATPAPPAEETKPAARTGDAERGRSERGGDQRGGGERGGRDARASGQRDSARGGSRERDRGGDRRGGRDRDRQGSGRGRGGEGRREGRAGGARGEGTKPETSKSEAPRSEAPKPEARKPETPKPEAAPPKREAKPETPKAEAAKPEPTAEAPRSLGRYRRGSRGRSPAAAAGGSSTASRIGPMPRKDEAEEKPPARDAEKPEAREASRDAASRGGVGTRRGSRGRGPAADDAKGEQPKREAAEPTPGGGAAADSGPVDHMVRNYPGVGKRTAEVLVETFGADVFDVIDREPERLAEVLSEGRARAVVAAREKEREG